MFTYVMAVLIVIFILSVFLSYLLKKNNLLNILMLIGIVIGSTVISLMFPFILNILLNINSFSLLTVILITFLIYFVLLAGLALILSQLIYSGNFEVIIQFISQNVFQNRVVKEYATYIGDYIKDKSIDSANYFEIDAQQDISAQQDTSVQEDISAQQDTSVQEDISAQQVTSVQDDISAQQDISVQDDINVQQEIGKQSEELSAIVQLNDFDVEDIQECDAQQEAENQLESQEQHESNEYDKMTDGFKAVEQPDKLQEAYEPAKTGELDKTEEPMEIDEFETFDTSDEDCDNIDTSGYETIPSNIIKYSNLENLKNKLIETDKKLLTFSDNIVEIIEEVFIKKQNGDFEGALALYFKLMATNPDDKLVFWLIPEICLLLRQLGQQDFARFILNDYEKRYGDLIKTSKIFDFI